MNSCFSNSIRGRFNAWILHVSEDMDHKTFGKWKQKIFEDIPDSIVELGPGTGSNFRYYPGGSVLTAIEPNQMMLDRLQKSAKQHEITLDLRQSRAEKLDIADGSARAVVSTQVLCTVDDLHQALKEVYRILKPGGRFLFIEHIAAPKGTVLRRVQEQKLIRQTWQWCMEGCRINCETNSALASVGFSKMQIQNFEIKSILPIPIRHYIAGIATK